MISVTESRKAFLGSLAINLNGFLRKFCGTGTAGSIDVFRKCSACPIHLPQLIQDHLGTVVVVLFVRFSTITLSSVVLAPLPVKVMV